MPLLLIKKVIIGERIKVTFEPTHFVIYVNNYNVSWLVQAFCGVRCNTKIILFIIVQICEIHQACPSGLAIFLNNVDYLKVELNISNLSAFPLTSVLFCVTVSALDVLVLEILSIV